MSHSTTMLHNTALLVMDGLVSVHVQFAEGGKDYVYAAPVELARRCRPGDPVVVETKSGNYRVVYFQSMDDELDIDPSADIAYRLVVDRVCMEDHEQRTQSLDTIVQEIKKRQRHARKEQALQALGVDSLALAGAINVSSS